MRELTFDNTGLADSVSQLTPDEAVRVREALQNCTGLEGMSDIMASPGDSVQTSAPSVIRAALCDIRDAANISDRQLWEPVQDHISFDRFHAALYYNDKALSQKEWNRVENEYSHYVLAYQEGINASQTTNRQ